MQKYRRIKKIGTIMQRVCLIIALGVAVSSLCLTAYLISSESMSPALESGDYVLMLNLMQPETLQEGDIAGYISTDGSVVIHRAVSPYLDAETDRVAWRMQGDANGGLDMQVLTAKNMVGKVIYRISKDAFPVFRDILRCIFLLPLVTVCVGGILRVYADAKLTVYSAQLAEADKKETEVTK